MTRLLLLRHGQSEWNAAGRWQGWADTGLTALGVRQAELAADRLVAEGAVFDAVASSDLSRSLVTAQILADALGLAPPLSVPGLREFDVGEWSGLTRPEIETAWPGALDAWRRGALERTPAGEARDVFAARVTSAIHALAAAHPEGCLLVVTHGGVIGTLQRLVGLDGQKEKLINLCGRWFEAGAGELSAGNPVALLDPDADSPAITPVP